MKLYIKQKVFSWGDKFTIKDEYGNDRFYVNGEVFSFGKKLHVTDIYGNEIIFIKQQIFTFLQKYEIIINGNYVARIVREFTFLKPKYTIEGTNWTIDGDYFAHDYQIIGGNRTIAYISKQWFSWGDSYEINIADPRDEILAVACVLAIDAAMSNDRN